MDSVGQSQTLSLINRLADQQIDSCKAEILQAVAKHDKIVDFGFLADKMAILVDKVYGREAEDLLKTLDFESRTGREANIDEAYARTFNWIFADAVPSKHLSHQMNFKEWLRTGSGIFWICGKAGSGKSTLMRHISNEPRMKQILQNWGANEKLITACYFFFNAGDTLQKSQQGLIRSMIYDILSQCPYMIPIVAQSRLHDHYLGSRPWKISELQDICRKLTQQSMNMKLCFFIDGLDEYDGVHRDVISIVRELATLPNIKLCVSSRPWNIFQESFGPIHQQIVLEQHTRTDIELYVKERLGQDQQLVSLTSEGSRASDLIGEIIENAQGVFLWVRLAVNDLLRGSVNHDDISELQRRLHYLPFTLEAYYQRAFDSIDKFYREATAEILLLALEAAQPFSLLAIVFYECEKQGQTKLKGPQSSMYHPSILCNVIEACRTRLHSRCQDFLVVRESSEDDVTFRYTVEFLHATAAGYVKKPEMRKRLETWVSLDFNPKLTLLGVTLTQIKCMHRLRHIEHNAPTLNNSSNFIVLVTQCMDYAYRLEKQDRVCPVMLLDRFNGAAQEYYSPNSPSEDEMSALEQDPYGREYYSWSGFIRTNEVPNPIMPHFWHDFLILAIQHDLQSYVIRKLNDCPALLHRNFGPPLLYYALATLTRTDTPREQCPRIPTEMIRILLKQGAQPYELFSLPPHFQHVTVFGVFLGQIHRERRRNHCASQELFDVTRMLIEHASDPMLLTRDIPLLQELFVTHRYPISLVIERLFTSTQASELNNALQKKRVELGVPWIPWLHYNVKQPGLMIAYFLIILVWIWVIVSEWGKLLRYVLSWVGTHWQEIR